MKGKKSIKELSVAQGVPVSTLHYYMEHGYKGKKLPYSRIGLKKFVADSTWSQWVRDTGGRLVADQ